MGAEALSKHSRRDIRRAFSPEASAEVFRFVAHCESHFEQQLTAAQDAQAGINNRVDTRLAALERPSTFRQRLTWLIRGTWE
jgi:hypothetical protein